MTEIATVNHRLMVWRIVMGSGLLAWFVKINAQYKLFTQGEHSIVHHTMLPDWLCDSGHGILFFFAPALCFASLFVRGKLWLRCAAILYVVSALLMLWHIQSYNDATHLTAFWVGLWLCWWAGKVDVIDQTSRWHGICLALCVLSICWLGGCAGKLTAEYWSGESFYHLYFVYKDYFPFSDLRTHCSEETLRSLACIFSRAIVVGEMLLATCLLWPVRLALLANVCALTLMVFISQIQLLSVLGPLIGLCLAISYLLEKEEPKPVAVAK